ncbi:MAG: macro domain-containing protein [Myxococcota bacterium]
MNASNPHVALGSGVSGAIADACGPAVQRVVRAAWEDEFDEPLTRAQRSARHRGQPVSGAAGAPRRRR